MYENSRSKILVVDDERANILALTHILKPDYTTMAAIDGRTAISIAKEYKPDLILLDIIMPGISGFEVLEELKRDAETTNIPVIFITGLDNDEDEEKGFLFGAVDYITKPFRNSIVRARVRTHLQMGEYIREIERFGVTDTLTNIANRRGFDNKIKIEWARALREQQPLSILLIDLDRFKLYNDTYGHTQGDILLQEAAGIFSKTLKRDGDFIARWGGEEFVVLLPNTDKHGATKVSEKIRANIEGSIIPCHDGMPTSVTISIGVNTEIPSPGGNITEFITKADNAMYIAKNSGRNRVCVV